MNGATALCASPEHKTTSTPAGTPAAWQPPTGDIPAAHLVPPTASGKARADGNDSPERARTVRSWPLLVLALPAAVTIWSGWVGIGEMTGFGQVHPLPGIWGSLHLNTAVTLPVGVEAYAAYALRAWLTASTTVSRRTRRFARWSVIASLLLGMAGQVAYHLLTQAHVSRAPWPITTAVSCLPVLVLGMGAALAHLLHADSNAPPAVTAGRSDHLSSSDHPVRSLDTTRLDRVAHAEAAAQRLIAAGQGVSRRTLRAAGVRGSNADLGALARALAIATIQVRT